MLWAALVLATSSPLASPLAPLAPLDPPRVDLPAATARTFHVEVGQASVSIALDVGAVGRPTRVPVRVQARPLDATRKEPGAARPVQLFVCDDLRCTLRTEMSVPLDDKPVVVDATLFPTGLALQLRHTDEQERSCCTTSGIGRTAHVIATTAPAGPHVDVVRESGGGGLVVAPVGEALFTRPALLDSYSGVIVADDSLRVISLVDPRAVPIAAFVRRGGIVSVASTTHIAPLLDDVTDAPAPSSEVVTYGGGPAFALQLPHGTRLARYGEGLVVLRPPGASREEQLAGLIAARPHLLSWTPMHGNGDSIAARAAGAGLAARPHRGVAFFVAFLCVVGAAMCIRGARRRGWRAALASSAAVAVVGVTVLAIVERVALPSETRTRVVAWIGDDAAWEVGVHAVRPRSTREVTVSAPIPPVTATVFGEDTLAPRTPTRSSGKDGDGKPEWRVTSTVGSSAALAVLWERAADTRRRQPVTLKNDVVTNHLDVPLRAVTLRRGSRITGALASHGSRSISEFSHVLHGQTADTGDVALTVMEQRLLYEIAEGCAARLVAAAAGEHPQCGAAIAVLDDDTLLGIEVSP